MALAETTLIECYEYNRTPVNGGEALHQSGRIFQKFRKSQEQIRKKSEDFLKQLGPSLRTEIVFHRMARFAIQT